MALKAQNVLVFGATGIIGRYIFDALLNEKQHFSRIALFTSPATAVNKTDELNKLKQRGAEVIVGDVFKISDVENAYKGMPVTSCPSPCVSVRLNSNPQNHNKYTL